MVVDILNFLLDGIYFVFDAFIVLVFESGVFGLCVAVFVFYSLYRFIFAPVFGSLRHGASDRVSKAIFDSVEK